MMGETSRTAAGLRQGQTKKRGRSRPLHHVTKLSLSKTPLSINCALPAPLIRTAGGGVGVFGEEVARCLLRREKSWSFLREISLLKMGNKITPDRNESRK